MLQRWGGQPLPLNASCWVHDDSVSPARDTLFVRLRGASAAVAAACPRLLATCKPQAVIARAWTTRRPAPTGTPAATKPCRSSSRPRPTWACGACPCRPLRPRWPCPTRP